MRVRVKCPALSALRCALLLAAAADALCAAFVAAASISKFLSNFTDLF